MIKRLCIKNFAIIEDIEVEFDSGMNVLIGETGAGKSIIIDAISLLMGGRSSYQKIRYGANKASIEGEFFVSEQLKQAINEEYGDLIEDDELIVIKTLDSSNKSVIRINSRVMPQSQVKAIMASILDIHSQHLNDSFFDEKKQGEILLQYMNLSSKLTKSDKKSIEDYEICYQNYLTAVKELKTLKETPLEETDLDYLQFQISELNKVDPQDNEIEDLKEEQLTLNNIAKLSEKMKMCIECFEEAETPLYQVKKTLSSLNDDSFDKDIEAFNDAYFALNDSFEEIKNKFEHYQSQAHRIDEINERLYALSNLARKYGRNDLKNKKNELEELILRVNSYQDDLLKKEKAVEKALNELSEASIPHDEVLKKYGDILSLEVNQQLSDLMLLNADFKVAFEKLDHPTKIGYYKILFMLRANLGGAYLPLKETASLGETSRLNLALKIVFNSVNPVETIIFDEVDTGVSGRVAISVSKKIHSISKYSQVLVITHLSQVAAISDHQYLVVKEDEDGVTKTRIKRLNENQFIDELAKMISGNNSEMATNLALSMIKELSCQ